MKQCYQCADGNFYLRDCFEGNLIFSEYKPCCVIKSRKYFETIKRFQQPWYTVIEEKQFIKSRRTIKDSGQLPLIYCNKNGKGEINAMQVPAVSNYLQ